MCRPNGRLPGLTGRRVPPESGEQRNGSGTPGKGTNGRAGRRGHSPARGTGNGQTGRAGPIFMQSQPDPLLWTPTPRRPQDAAGPDSRGPWAI